MSAPSSPRAIIRERAKAGTPEADRVDLIALIIKHCERVRFEVAGGNYRLVAAFDFRRQVAFVKFVGTHAEYDRVDALTVTRF
jgi:mRNA interferase HigB